MVELFLLSKFIKTRILQAPASNPLATSSASAFHGLEYKFFPKSSTAFHVKLNSFRFSSIQYL
jgi:hypothetical protein